MKNVILVSLFIWAGVMSAQAQEYPSFDIQGHRGARGRMPENTMPAMIYALNQHVNTLEMDVVISADSQVVVSHDPYLNHVFCTDTVGQVIDSAAEQSWKLFQMPYEEIAKCDCGSKGNPNFPQQKKLSVHKPLLSEVLQKTQQFIRNNNRMPVFYNIEIKSTVAGDSIEHPAIPVFCDLVHQVIANNIAPVFVTIQSFDLRALEYWHEHFPEYRLSLLVENKEGVEANLDKLSFKPFVYSCDYHLLSHEDVRLLHRKGIRVIPWTVDDIWDMRRLVAWGVDGLITDYPERATQLK